MKKLFCLIGIAAAAALLSGCAKSSAKESLTVFNYGEYIDPEVLDLFTEETGIEIKYEEALTPEEMYAKYSSGAISYDLLCTSDYMVQRLIQEGETQKVDFSSMEYAGNIGEKYWDFSKAFDENNEYALPYFYGTIGILYDTTKVDGTIDSWSVLFDGSYKDEIIMQNSQRDTFMITLKYLGYSLNTTEEAQLREAQQLLLKQKSDVQAYLVDEARDEVVAGNATMAVVYSGEAYLGHEYNENLAYVVPKEGSNVWIDSWVVTKKCKNTEAAEKFLDFLCREDVAQMNFEYIYYSTPNEAVVDAMSEELKNNPAIVPSEEDMSNCEVCTQADAATTKLYNELWKELKAD
jgi:spermidine/putrescine-binding protein